MRSSLFESCSWSWRESLRGLQLGIGLGDADDPADGRAEALLLACAHLGLRADRSVARARRGLDHGALVRGVRGHRLVELGHEVGPPAQLRVDVAPGGAGAVAGARQPVVEQQGEDDDDRHDRCSSPDQHAARLPAQFAWIDARGLPRQRGGVEALDQVARSTGLGALEQPGAVREPADEGRSGRRPGRAAPRARRRRGASRAAGRRGRAAAGRVRSPGRAPARAARRAGADEPSSRAGPLRARHA